MQSDRWINDMGEYYRHNKEVPAIKITMLLDVYGQNESETLERAAYLYMMDNEHFPSVKRFLPYMETASHEKVARTIRRVHRLTDDERFAAEVAHLQKNPEQDGFDFSDYGMRPLPEIETEIDEARLQLREMVA